MSVGLSRPEPRSKVQGANRPLPVRVEDVFRDKGRGVAWVTATLVAVVLCLAGVSGVLVSGLFHQYSTLKWVLTIVGPLFLVLLLTVRRPSMWSVGLVVLSVPVAPYVMTVGSQPVSILVVTAVLATVVITVEGGVRAGRRTRSSLARVTPWIVLLLAMPTVLGGSSGHEILYLALVVDIAWMCTRVADLYPDGRLGIVLVFLGTAGSQAALALVQHGTGRQFNLYGGAGNATFSSSHYFFNYGAAARTTGTFFDPISLGNVLAMAFPLALLVVVRSDLDRRHRWFAGAMGALLLGGLTVSLSRASWLGAIGGVVAVCLFSRGEQRRRAVVLSVTLTILAIVLASALYGPALTARVDSILHPTAANVRTAAGDRARQAAWSFAVTTFEHAPLTGVGIGKLAADYEQHVAGSDASTHASDVYLQYLAEAGLLGGAALVLLAGGVAADLYRARRNDPLLPGLAGAFIGVAITWVTDYTVRYYAVAGCLALLLGLAASAGGTSPEQRSAPPPVRVAGRA